MPRPQFTLRALLVAMLVVAAFFGGVVYGKRLARQQYAEGWLELQEKAGELGVELH